MSSLKRDPLAEAIIGAAVDVHRALGPGLLEQGCKQCLGYEFTSRKIPFEAEVPLPLIYKNTRMDCGFRADFVVDASIVVEVKSVQVLLPIHKAQTITYLRLSGARQALLLNFNEVTLKKGIRSYLRWEPGNPSEDPVG